MAVWSIYKSGSSTIYIYSQEVRILQNLLKVQNVLFQEVQKFLTSKNVFYIFKMTYFKFDDFYFDLKWLLHLMF